MKSQTHCSFTQTQGMVFNGGRESSFYREKNTIERFPLIRYGVMRMFTILKKMLILFKLLFGFFEKGTESHYSVLGGVKAVSQDDLNWLGLQYKQELTHLLKPSPPRSVNVKHLVQLPHWLGIPELKLRHSDLCRAACSSLRATKGLWPLIRS